MFSGCIGDAVWLWVNKGVSEKGVTCLLGDKRQPENKIWLFRLPLLVFWFAIFRLPQMKQKKQLFKRVKELLPMLVFCLSALLVGNQFAQRQHQLLIGKRFADKATRAVLQGF